MKKLYFPKGSPTHYWEYWNNDNGTFTVHQGELGSEGESEIISRKLLKSARSQVKTLEKLFLSKGYAEIKFEDQKILLVEYAVDGFGTNDDLSKRHSLQELMNEILGWTGLGDCDGGSIGSGTMEVCCYVVDFNIARAIILDKLRNTKFSNFTRIYQEN